MCTMFLERHSNVNGVKTLLKKVNVTGSIDRQPGSGHPHSASTTARISEVGDLALSPEDNQACVRENGGHFEHRL